MEQPHLSSQLEYLERRIQESHSLIAKLQQRVEAQEYQLQEKSHRIESLETQLDDANAEIARIAHLDEQLNSVKDDMRQMIDQRIHRLQPAQADPTNSGNMLAQQVENQTKALNTLRREVEKTERFDEQIALARTESQRLSKSIIEFQAKLEALGKQLDDRVKPIRLLEDQRRSDMRILTELQAEIPKLHQKADSSLTKVQIVEQKIPQFAKYEAALDGMREEIRRHREHLDYQIAQRERQVKDWSELAETAARHIAESRRDMGKYAEHYQLNRRALASLQDFQERLKNEQHRFGELQRLTEERQRTEFEKFQAELEQRFQKRSMEIEPHLTDFERSVEVVQKRIEEVDKYSKSLEEQVTLLMQIVEEDIQARTIATMSWQQRFEEIAGNGQS
ncbi:MAG: hypothetical protein H6633_31725 [Anaerolineales bacterium]|nr:hypothetical protein [Anaerolineales bacterium]